MATTEAHPGQLGGYRHASPSGYVRWTQRRGAPRFYNMPQQPDLGAAIAGALAGAALQLIPRATEALIAKLPPAVISSGRLKFENLADDLQSLARLVMAQDSGGKMHIVYYDTTEQ